MVLVDDKSTDNSWEIIQEYAGKHDFIIPVQTQDAGDDYLPGSKVVAAFNAGFVHVDPHTEIVCKFDADLIFPSNYLKGIVTEFESNPKAGVVGGVCSVADANGSFVVEQIADKDHVRGALKAYRMACFKDVGGLRESMGWDTIDELLSMYYKWEVRLLEQLEVQHLRPTGTSYNLKAQKLRGEALYKMGYGPLLALLACIKMSLKNGRIVYFPVYYWSYLMAPLRKVNRLTNSSETRFIRKYRWSKIRNKILG